jgi:hypothetical protein
MNIMQTFKRRNTRELYKHCGYERPGFFDPAVAYKQ